jgi:hypothetical protein
MKEIYEIRSQIEQLKQKISEAEKRLEDAGLRHLGLSIGDIIVAHVGTKRECLASVKGCVARWGNTPRVEAFKIKKDGTVSEISAGHISEWAKP